MTDSTEVKKSKTKKKKKYQIGTYMKTIYLEKKTTIVEASSKAEAFELCEKIEEEQMKAGTYSADIVTLDSWLPDENISSMWIEKIGTKIPKFDPFDSPDDKEPPPPIKSKKRGSCGRHGDDVELWWICSHVRDGVSGNVSFSRFKEGEGCPNCATGHAFCFACESAQEKWTTEQAQSIVSIMCQGCLRDMVAEMSRYKSKEQIDQMFFGLEDL